MDKEREIRSWDEEEDNLENKIEKFWAEDEEAFRGFASHNSQSSHCFQHHTPNQSRIDDDAIAGGVHNSHDSRCTTSILLSPAFNLQEVDSRHRLLGLTLKKTPSFMSLLEMRVSTPNVVTRDNHISDNGTTMHNIVGCSQTLSEKLKASNFPISAIKIGAWRWVSMREGDLTAKVYYAKRKLVWEVLDGQLKSKMEILWSDITAINAVMLPNQPGILQIELDKPPSFFRETPPEPRKHTTWQQASDFTGGGQASQYRRHIAIFPSGVLDKHYEKLLRYDQHLLELSKRPFPSQEFPYFNTAMPFDISGLPVNLHGLGPTFLPLAQQYPLNPTITVNTPNRNERAINCQHQLQQATRFYPRTDLYFEEPSPTTGNQVFPGHNYPLNVAKLNEIHEKHLLGDSQVQSMGSLFIPNNNNAIYHSRMGYQISDDATSVDQVMMQNATHDNVPIIQPINWLPSPPLQGSNDSIITMEPEVVDNFVPLANEDLFSTVYPNQGVLKKY